MEAFATFTPSGVHLHAELDSTGLIQFGSRVSHKRFYKTETDADAEIIGEQMEPYFKKNMDIGMIPLRKRKEELGKMVSVSV